MKVWLFDSNNCNIYAVAIVVANTEDEAIKVLKDYANSNDESLLDDISFAPDEVKGLSSPLKEPKVITAWTSGMY